ncbi:MAG: FHA domain-containing protein [Schaedlerella sp.]|nr:FHA domain-containing protein [Schaedlerella sp.]
MEDRTNGWISLEEINIPPLETEGFQSDIIIREKIEPIVVKRPQKPVLTEEPKAVYKEKYTGDEATVLLHDEEEYDGEEATVLIDRDEVIEAYLKRIKTGEIFRVDKERFVIGKSMKADYVIKDDPTISRQHAAIVLEASGYFLEDLESANHTFVNGSIIKRPVSLVNGMTFTLSEDEAFEFTVTIIR